MSLTVSPGIPSLFSGTTFPPLDEKVLSSGMGMVSLVVFSSAEVGAVGLEELISHHGSRFLKLTFHCQLHCHLAGTTIIGGFTGVFSLVLLTDSTNDKAESPPDTTVQQEAAPTGDGLPISVPCHMGLWVTPDLQGKEEKVRAYTSRVFPMCQVWLSVLHVLTHNFP